MKKLLIFAILIGLSISCSKQKSSNSFIKVDWSNRIAHSEQLDNLKQGKTYLPVYSHIYHMHQHLTYDLTATISIRNISEKDTLYLLKADYYNTQGDKIRSYIEKPIYVRPMETIEIVISETDNEGGSGANFIFNWAMKTDKNPPLFEAVMISTDGQQGLSFSTQGILVTD